MISEKHSQELELYQLVAGREEGKLVLAMTILENVKELLVPSMVSNVTKDEIRTELDEAKQLMANVLEFLVGSACR